MTPEELEARLQHDVTEFFKSNGYLPKIEARWDQQPRRGPKFIRVLVTKPVDEAANGR